MERQLILTKDGSHSIYIPEQDVTYHSRHGAIQESMKVFISPGLLPLMENQNELHVFEMGFGTGLNALLTFLHAEKDGQKIYYDALEKFPLDDDIIREINYCTQLNRTDLQAIFEAMHYSEWGKNLSITESFILHKTKADLISYRSEKKYHLIYYDAFAPNAQPELWTASIFAKLSSMLFPGAYLLTYCSKGIVRRSMQAAGLIVEKLPGPPGKREIVRAIKP